MKFLAYCKNNLKNEKGFSLLEMVIVITISSLLALVFLQLNISLYQNNRFFNLHNAWQLDAYLALDFIAEQIKNSLKVEIINQQEIDIYTFYDQDYQWLKFSFAKSDENNKLARSIGSQDLNNKDFGKNLSLLDQIKDLKFVLVREDLLKITLSIEANKEKIVVSRLIKIN